MEHTNQLPLTTNMNIRKYETEQRVPQLGILSLFEFYRFDNSTLQ